MYYLIAYYSIYVIVQVMEKRNGMEWTGEGGRRDIYYELRSTLAPNNNNDNNNNDEDNQ